MIIDRNLTSFMVYCEDAIAEALKKISKNDGRIVFSVSERGMLEGVLTNGDFRRWLADNPDFDVTRPVSRVSNKNYKFAYLDDETDRISAAMGDHTCLPLLDRNGHLVAVARRTPAEVIQIDGRAIADDAPTFIIAEIGLNHNGSLELAKELIDLAAAAGADSAKFQMRDLKSLYRSAPKIGASSEDLGTQYTLGLLQRFELKTEQMFEAFDHCKARGVVPMCTPWDFESLDRLQEYGMQAYKVASADLTNHDLLRAMAETKKVMICSTGMSMEQEIIEAVDLLRETRATYVLMHCNSTYPAPFKDVHLRYLHRLKEIGRCVVGYSGHERGQSVVLAAVASGARVIEKHFTIDKEMEGNDHKVSLLPDELTEMVKSIRQVEAALGSAGERKMTQGEMMNRSNLAKSLIINQDLAAGETISAEMVIVRSPGRGIQPNRKTDLIGRRAKRAFTSGDFFFESDLDNDHVEVRNYRFKRPWGIPVRYHDFRKIMAKSNPDFLEFHLSFKDVDENVHDHLQEKLDFDLVVHSPDLFEGDHLLNLCTVDADYRKRSLFELQRVVDLTRSMRDFFGKVTERSILIASIGGFSKEAPLTPAQMREAYEIAGESLSHLKTDGVEILPQTLPPFPWYFGGQLFANLFVQAEDTAEFSRTYGYRLCFDVCHSKLACNHFGTPFLDFCEKVGPYSGHLHIADAGGVDGEGLQIGEGDMDFAAMAEVLDRTCPKASFIPEIWQGHKNEGEGFWLAASRLEGLY
ncbi:MAG: N-acetylneuraminate synthase family protein [Chthoniobacterales bacterium]|nr:N-acetylneuraminate synthase family protein [Chthoniobacterales bacterium]